MRCDVNEAMDEGGEDGQGVSGTLWRVRLDGGDADVGVRCVVAYGGDGWV